MTPVDRAPARNPRVPTWPGLPEPLGVTWDGGGINVAVWSEHATALDVCLFAPDGSETRVPLRERTGPIWHGYLPGIAPGQRYGFRADGPYAPHAGMRFNPAKLLVDPYARQIEGGLTMDPAVFAYPDAETSGPRRDARDSAPFVPRCIVTGAHFPWGDDRLPRVPWSETVLYEMHVKGFTALHPGVPPELRGTYAGLAHPAAIEHLTRLGVTSVELLPVQAFVSETHLLSRGRQNYWGYNTLGFFAPHSGYAASGYPVSEFKAMVRTLHAAGLEVVLDVVYNHTAEGGEGGPTLSLRGLDNAAYYRLAADRRYYDDSTGCGNTLDLAAAPVLQLVLDSLRYWATEMHVDGFRFDLASSLTRDSAFLEAVGQDPVLRGLKLIAEPWDLRSYEVGSFPWPWAEWNGRYRDAVRDAWRGEAPDLAEIATRLSGSSDLYASRSPQASINFVTVHDGFPLADLVSYERKHNEANGEQNRDGTDDNRSRSGGIEGPTDDVRITEARRRLRRAHLATLLLSAGVPMLLAGDELGRTQLGNNNAYCQDNEISHLAWPYDRRDPAGSDPMLPTLVRGLVDLRRRSPVLCRTTFFRGGPSSAGDLADISWFRPDGQEMSSSDWAGAQTLLAHLSGQALLARGSRGERLTDESYLLVLHIGADDREVTLPGRPWARLYLPILDTAAEDLGGFPAGEGGTAVRGGGRLATRARSLQLLRIIG